VGPAANDLPKKQRPSFRGRLKGYFIEKSNQEHEVNTIAGKEEGSWIYETGTPLRKRQQRGP